jgi:hypothetical protein
MYINSINFLDTTQPIPCKMGDALLFDSNLIHSGSFNKDENNPRIQMKLSHKDDISKFSYYQQYNKVLEKDNKHNKYFQIIQKYLSCQFPIISDITNYDIKNNFFHNTKFKELIGYFFYGNTQFYNYKELFTY